MTIIETLGAHDPCQLTELRLDVVPVRGDHRKLVVIDRDGQRTVHHAVTDQTQTVTAALRRSEGARGGQERSEEVRRDQCSSVQLLGNQ